MNTNQQIKYRVKTYLTVGLVFLFFIRLATAQTLELGIGLGLSAYNGDLLPQAISFPKTSGIAGQVQLSLLLNERFKVQLFYNRGRLTGSDADFDRENRNLSFSTNIDEVGIRGIFHFIPFDPYGEVGSPFTIYAGTGVSIFHFNPFTTNFQGQKTFLHDLGTAGQFLPNEQNVPRPYNLFQPGIPITMGVSYAITERVIIGLEADYRWLFTDYLDDIGHDLYPDFDNLLLSSDQAALLTNRGWENIYNADDGINPIDVASRYFQDNNLAGSYRSIGTGNDVFGFIFFKISYLLDEISFGGRSKFGCYSF